MAQKNEALYRKLLRPAGFGVPVFSAGKTQSITLDQAWKLWEKNLERLPKAKVVLLGVPLDTGAGIRRGAMGGPDGLRAALPSLSKVDSAQYQEWIREGEVVDLGDLYVNPHLLHDQMLNAEQIKAAQEAMYGGEELPVSALSQLEFVLNALFKDFPALKPFVIGGDHSVGWPMASALFKKHGKKLGIVQPDAHTDLLESRLGVKYCFGTWSFHANELIGGGGKLVQVGIRNSGKSKAHWESSLGVKQFWSDEILSQPHDQTIQEITGHLMRSGVTHLYFSNDIDGTDSSEMSATGTPEPKGPDSSFFFELIEALREEFTWVGADLVELAPDLGPTPEASRETCLLSAGYAFKCIRALLDK